MTIQLTDREIFDRPNEEVFLDIELYPNYFLVCIEYANGGRVYFEADETNGFNNRKLLWILQNNLCYTFNGNNYDIPLIKCWLLSSSVSVAKLHQASVDIIDHALRMYDLYKRFRINGYDVIWNHVDLKELPRGVDGLKTYAARLNVKELEDLPYDPYAKLTPDQKTKVLRYCWKDVFNTTVLKNNLQEQISIREKMSLNYGVDLRSKSDAQIAEAVIGKELWAKYHINAKKAKLDTTYSFKYNVPDFVKFKTPVLQAALEVIRTLDFTLSEYGQVQMPAVLTKMKLKIGKTVYKLGLGGLHSTEKWIHENTCDLFTLIDRDVASYYPYLILTQGLYPKHLTSAFLLVFKDIVETRIKAKHSGDTVTADTLKIVVNGSFGKFGDPHSILYSPDLMIQVTLSGQLYLLMLIEQMVLDGHSVISGNTDGFVTKIRRDEKHDFDKRIAEWEALTGLSTEETEYSRYYGRDVNNYVAVKPGGKTKLKGCFAETGISKSPSGSIIFEAVANFISRGADIDTTIRTCTDLGKFIFLRTVKGGAIDQRGNILGKTVRWYLSKNEYSPIRYKSDNSKVAMSDGGRVVLDLPDEFPSDISYVSYTQQANTILQAWLGKREQLEFDL